MKNDQVKLQIVNTARAIKRKYIALRKGEQQEEEKAAKFLKPLMQPLKQIIANVENKKQNVTPPPPPPPPMFSSSLLKSVKKKHISPQSTSKKLTFTPDFLSEGEVFELSASDEMDEEKGDVSQPQLQEDISVIEDSPYFKEYIDQYDPLPKKYVLKYLERDGIDFRGIKYDSISSKWSLGKTPIEFSGKDLIISGKRYTGTPGLYELLFMKIPKDVKKEDAKNYHEIIDKTNLYRRNYDPQEQKKGNKSEKYKLYVQPLTGTSRLKKIYMHPLVLAY